MVTIAGLKKTRKLTIKHISMRAMIIKYGFITIKVINNEANTTKIYKESESA
jgi:hypothetical protein